MISVYHIFREKTTMKMKHDESTNTRKKNVRQQAFCVY